MVVLGRGGGVWDGNDGVVGVVFGVVVFVFGVVFVGVSMVFCVLEEGVGCVFM